MPASDPPSPAASATTPAASVPSAAVRFGFQLVGLSRRWRRHLDEGLASAGLTDATWTPLMHLAKAGPLCQKDLAARVGLDGSSLVRLIDILERQGLVARTIDGRDRRARQLSLTPAGTSAVKLLEQRIETIELAMLDGIGEAELANALDVFAHIEARLADLNAAKER